MDDLQQIAFPHLSQQQLDQLEKRGSRRTYEDGEAIWQAGDENISCYVVLSGGIDIWLGRSTEKEHIACHTAGSFSGDIDLLSGKAVVVSATAHDKTELLELSHATLRSIVVQESSISDILVAAFLARRAILLDHSDSAQLVVVGPETNADTHHIREFLLKNQLPHRWMKPEDDQALDGFLTNTVQACDKYPIVIDTQGDVHPQMTVTAIAELTGLRRRVTEAVYDAAVIGAGPGGLAATVYAASEGLSVVTIDRLGPGGQAGTSSKIENYLGFPTGISGPDLAAAALTQANKFGALVSVAHEATGIDCDQSDGLYRINVQEGIIQTRSIVVATGARYRHLQFEGSRRFDGSGVYYGATNMEGQLCSGEDVLLVGGGNSAGQAAVFLSAHAKHVHILIRRKDLADTMSDYLIRRIDQAANITLHTETEVQSLHGTDSLQQVTTRHNPTQDEKTWDISKLFLFLGAEPATDWLQGCIATDQRGFILTGSDLDLPALINSGWQTARYPAFLEASKPGVYAVGDVRSGSTKRVASAVGEGSMAVQYVHRYLSGL